MEIFRQIVDLLRPDVSQEAKVSGVLLFVGKTLDKWSERLDAIETKTLIPIRSGVDGAAGKDGKDGVPGPTGLRGKDGKNGQPGKDGAPGKDGKDGTSVVDSEIAADGHLVLKLSNGNIIDAGELPGVGGGKILHSTVHERPQVTVSSTAPPNPQPNDLWYDIS